MKEKQKREKIEYITKYIRPAVFYPVTAFDRNLGRLIFNSSVCDSRYKSVT